MGICRYGAVSLAPVFLTAVCLALPASAQAADVETACRWTGRGADNHWSTIANWTNCDDAAPRNGSAIEFPRGADRSATRNDIAGLSLVALHITGTAAGDTPYDIAGLPFTFTDTLHTVDAESASGAGPVVRTPMVLTGRAALNVASQRLLLTGALTGSGALVKTGPGTLTLTGDSSYTGGTLVGGGRLIVDGHLNRASPMIVDHGRLGGTGTVGRISCGTGVIAIGGSGTLAGILHGDGLVLAGTLLIGLQGPDAGTTYDQLDLTDDATLLIGATLEVGSVSFSPAVGAPAKGTQYTIIRVAAGHTLTGTFENLPEGKSFLIGRQPFRITYHGGSGYDVVLTALDDPSVADPGARQFTHR